MAIICKTTCFVADKNGNVTEYTPGPVANKTSKWLNSLNPIQRAKFEYVRKQRVSAPMVEYTDSQFIEIISHYLNDMGRSELADTMAATTDHSRDSIDAVVSMLQKLDDRMGRSRRMGISPRLIELAQAIDPDRFQAG